MKELELKLKTVPKNDESMSIRLTESDYLKMKLEYHIESNTRFDEESTGDQRDYASQLNSLLLDYILRNFTLDEIFIIFFENQICWFLNDDDIRLSKELAIENINCQKSCPPEAQKRMKKKVWNIPNVLYGLVQVLIRESKLFLNAEKGIYEFPDLSNVSIKFAFISE